MKEYICKEVPTDNGGYLEIEKELIRCKDCKYFLNQYFSNKYADGGCIHMAGKVYCKKDDFCSCAESREDHE